MSGLRSLPPDTEESALRDMARSANNETQMSAARTVRYWPVLAELAESDSAAVRFTVAHNPYTSTATVGALMDDEDRDVRNAAANNPNGPPDRLATLASSPDETQRLRASRAAACDAATFAALAADPSLLVREAVALNRHTPPSVLALLLSDGTDMIRTFAAAHRSNGAALNGLLDDGKLWTDAAVAVGAASNPACPRRVLAALATDSNPDVAHHVIWNPSTTEEMRDTVLRRFAGGILRERMFAGPGLAKGSETPAVGERTVRFLASDGADKERRILAAAHPDSPAALIEALAADPEESVREATAATSCDIADNIAALRHCVNSLRHAGLDVESIAAVAGLDRR